jgi:hypothetical protein
MAPGRGVIVGAVGLGICGCASVLGLEGDYEEAVDGGGGWAGDDGSTGAEVSGDGSSSEAGGSDGGSDTRSDGSSDGTNDTPNDRPPDQVTSGCSPGSTEPCSVCGTTGNATCTSSSTWGTCTPPAGLCAFVNQGCSAQCDTVSSCWPHVDRSFSAALGEHFYTTSDSEAACCGFTVEDKPYFYLYSAQQTGLAQFYRCLLASGFHFYTTSSTCEGAAGATNEGSMGYIATSALCGSVPLHRLTAPNGDHLYTISSSEVTTAEAGGYVYEFVAGYVWTAPQ